MNGPKDYTRRSFLGQAAAAAAVVPAAGAAATLAGCEASSGSASDRAARTPHRTAIAENSLPGDKDWWIKHLGAPDAIMGYASAASILPGEPIHLYVSTTSREFTVKAFRMGWYRGDLARLVWQSGPIRGHRQRAASFIDETRTVHTRWGMSHAIAETHDWPAGSYLLRLDSHSGQRYVPITVRSASAEGKVILKSAVSTWQAYNTWGDYDLYKGPGGSYDDRSYVVSLDRPYDESGAYLFMVYERKLVNLAERMGLPLAYMTSVDIEREGDKLLRGAAALVSPGHDEYWTPQERWHVAAARDRGCNLAFLGANAMFRRIRMEPSALGPNREVVCYKTDYMLDPLYGKDDQLVTNDFREPPDPDPESSVIGTLYESYPTVADFVVATPDAWMFKGTGVRKGHAFRSLIGIEYDRVNPGYPLERPIQILSHSPLTCNGVNSYADSAYYTHKGGAGVFNAGTMRWVESFAAPLYHWGITKQCGNFTRRVTANVLRAFADGPAAHKHPAHDNVEALRAWPGDPITSGHNLWPPVIL
jgi:hypothetical protein